MEPLIGTILLFAGNFAPKGWMFCDGQLLPTSQYSALYSILGTTYGGDGINTFALPDLRGRVPLGPRQGPGLTPRPLGSKVGEETVTLTVNQIPSHSHAVNASSDASNQRSPTNTVLATDTSGGYQDGKPGVVMNPSMIGNTGGSQPHDNMQPSLALNYIIAIEGVYPSHS